MAFDLVVGREYKNQAFRYREKLCEFELNKKFSFNFSQSPNFGYSTYHYTTSGSLDELWGSYVVYPRAYSSIYIVLTITNWTRVIGLQESSLGISIVTLVGTCSSFRIAMVQIICIWRWSGPSRSRGMGSTCAGTTGKEQTIFVFT